MSDFTEEEFRKLLDAGSTSSDKLIEFVMTKFRALEAENAIYRDRLDKVQAKADEKVDQMTQVYAGYIMAKCGRKTIVVDPDELATRFAYDRVTRSVAKGGVIRYTLASVDAPAPGKSPRTPRIPKKGA